ncbi:transposase IS3 [Salmonella enterica subsp. enterica serovar Kentucky str. 22694]|nr:transposase IS3 [Salmonella enterica subsp. enterica serovar Kentucky str. 29166]ERN64453.1 transposase IS3 [Salmonella enterica subsp. enterica serovar Kentucky str. 13562]ERN64855.1 transposase IS3 [Salmonella enterica subsp. enterica serovar Kentucky str. 22694]ERN73833.1 transposase IS3 [Salmonella enterica subsp. enterica serovar Kentucky str. N312]ERN79858.1 transposase IS3 [Salmonella enterica subsp. enterica serovar Kentucky str. 20793]
MSKLSINRYPRKQHSSKFRQEALNRMNAFGVAAVAYELSLYESQLYV